METSFSRPAPHGNYDSEIIKQRDFSTTDHKYRTAPRFLEQHRQILRGAAKLSGMKMDGKFDPGIFPYFDPASEFPPTLDRSGGHIDFTDSIVLEKVKNVLLSTPDKSPLNEDQFTFSIHPGMSGEIDLLFESGFALLCNQADLWQHFVQDALHFLVFSADFLKEHSAVPIFLYKLNHPSILSVIRGSLGLSNPIIEFPLHPSDCKNYGIRDLYLCGFQPRSHLYSCSPAARRTVNLRLSDCSAPKKNLLYLSRNGRTTRSPSNEAEIARVLERVAESKSLDFNLVNPDQTPFEEVASLARSAQIMVAPHGGANYYCYWMSPGSQFVEFVFPEGMETLLPIACSIGLDYWMLPTPGTHHFSRSFIANPGDLSEVLLGST